MRIPSQLEIANIAGVSRSTVAWALSPKRRHRLRSETRLRVEQVARQLGYRPHRYAKIMREGRSGVIGMLRFAGFSPLRAELEHHVLRRIRGGGYNPMALRSMPAPHDVSAVCEELLDARVEGVIIEGPNFSETQDVVARFQRAGIPLVVLSGSEVPDTIHVRCDMKQSMADLTRHLIRLGHTRLLLLLQWVDPLVYRYDWWRNDDKLAGFIAAICEAGGSVTDGSGRLDQLSRLNPEVRPVAGDSNLIGEIEFIPAEWNWFNPYHESMRATENLLRRGLPAHSVPRNGRRKAGMLPTALMCANDDFAIGAMAACARASVRVPGDMAVTGFDNHPVGEYLAAPLTTVAQPNESKARMAVEILLELISGKGRATPDVIKLPARLIIRESCGAKLRDPQPSFSPFPDKRDED